MKTVKLVIIATLVAFAMVTVASADGFKSKPKFTKMVNLTIDKAMQDQGLVAAMYAQLNEDDILHFALPPFIFEVNYNEAHYLISGTREQWIRFFRLLGGPPVNTNKGKRTN